MPGGGGRGRGELASIPIGEATRTSQPERGRSFAPTVPNGLVAMLLLLPLCMSDVRLILSGGLADSKWA